MQKTLLLTAAAMVAMSVSAQSLTLNSAMQSELAKTEMINKFLNTEVGKRFNEQQVREAMNQPQITADDGDVLATMTLVEENFEKWAKGTNDEPDTDIVADEQVDELCSAPGWTAFQCQQAGGAVYQSYDEVGEDGPGYLMTPDFNVSENQGVFRFTARVKNVNPNATSYPLQYFVLDNASSAMISAASIDMGYDEWTEVSFVAHSSSAQTTVMFFSWAGKVLVDQVTVKELIYRLDTPANIKFEAVSGTEVKLSCDPVENATGYKFIVSSRNSGFEYNVMSEGPEVIVEGQFDADEDLIVTVVACDGETESYPATTYGPISYDGEIEAPVALAASNVTNEGFTANWESSYWANTYEVTLTRTHTVTEGETLYYMQEDFSEVPYTTDDVESTVMTTDGSLVSLDSYINAKGWNTYLAVVAQGMLGLTNMYEAYGFPGLLVSDAKDFSFGGGKVKISGMGMSMVDDVVVKVGFAEANQTMFGTSYSFLDGAQEFELSTSGSMFNVEIEGGTESSYLLIQMVDAAPEGDMALFLSLDMSAEAEAGQQVTGLYDVVTVPGLQTSYDVAVDFPEGDSFTYSVVGKFGKNASEASDEIVVEAPGTVGIDRTEVNAKLAEFFTLDGRRVKTSDINSLQNGTYIMRSNGASAKVMK